MGRFDDLMIYDFSPYPAIVCWLSATMAIVAALLLAFRNITVLTLVALILFAVSWRVHGRPRVEAIDESA